MKALLCLCFLSFFVQSNLDEIRKQYTSASQSKEATEAFYNFVSKQKVDKGVILAYKGSASIMLSKYTKEKVKRKELLTTGVHNIENSIKINPNVFELRIIRLSVQENLPKIVKYNSNIPEDKAFIITHYSKQDKRLQEYTQAFVKQSKSFTDTEKKQLIK